MVRVLLASSSLLVACSLQSNAISPVPLDGGGSDADAMLPDGTVDGGPTCTELAAEPSVVAIVEGDDLLRARGVEYERTETQEPGVVALAANPHRYGRWAFWGYEEPLLQDPPNLADLEGNTAVAAAFRDDLDEALSAGEAPHDLLVTRDDRYTVEVEGELYLEAGTTDVHLDVDDRGVLFVEVDGTTFTVRQSSPGESTVTVTAATAGYYPVRAAWHDEGGPGRFHVEITPPDGSRRAPTASEMRVDALALRGREVIGWESRSPDGDSIGSRIDLDETSWRDTGGAAYEGVGIAASDNWSVRWFGRQVFADPIDDVRIRAGDTHALWIDGVFLGGGGNASYFTPAPDGLVDVVTDLSDSSGGSELHYEVDSAPIAFEQLRPATRFGGTPHGVGEEFSHSISTTRTETLDLSVIPGAAPSAVEVSVVVRTDDPASVMVSVAEPNGMMHSQSLAAASWSREGGVWLLRWVPPWSSSLATAAGIWEITVDNTGSSTVTWLAQGVLAHLGGASEAHALTGRFRTAIIDLGDDTEVTGVRAGGMWNGHSDVRFALRAAASPAEVEARDFTDANADGDLSVGERGRYVQIEATLTGPGWDTPRIRDLRILGRACRRCAEVDPTTCPEERTRDGLVGLWLFDEGGGNVVRDVSGYRVHDLLSPSEAMFTWESSFVDVTAGRFTVDRPVDALREAFEAANALTVEAWVRPVDDIQAGPARILSVSSDPTAQNLMLGQDGERYEGRIQRDGADSQVVSASASVPSGELQHVVLTRTADGVGQLWVDGIASGASESSTEPIGDWDPSHRLYVANEATDDRQWAGEIHLVALYARALTPDEIARHHRAGP